MIRTVIVNPEAAPEPGIYESRVESFDVGTATLYVRIVAEGEGSGLFEVEKKEEA